MKRTWLLLLVCMLLLCIKTNALAAMPNMYEHENNDTVENAEYLCLNSVTHGMMSYTDRKRDTDCYRMYIPTDGEITFKFKHDYFNSSSNYFDLTLYYRGTTQKIWSTSIAGKDTDLAFYPIYLGKGEYDVVLSSKYNETSEYQLIAEYTTIGLCEHENNDSPQAATTLPVNKLMMGSLTNSNDVDYYVFTLANPGKVNLHFDHDYFDNGSTYYKVSITKGANGAKMRSSSYSGRDVNQRSYDFYLDAGTYYVKVESYYHSYVPYRLKIEYTSDTNTERESNDTFQTANSIPLNTFIKGVFSVDDDVDYYTFTLKEPGIVQFLHRHEYFDNGSTYYRVYLYDAANSNAELFNESLSGRDSEFNRWEVFLPEGTYYVMYKTYYHTYKPYQFRISFTPDANIERERNDSYQTATKIQPNVEYHGALMTSDDVDYYQFTLAQDSRVAISFNFNYLDNGSTYFKLALDLGKSSNDVYFSANLSGRDSQYRSKNFYLPAGTYYIRVNDYYTYVCPYTLKVSAVTSSSIEHEWNNSYGNATPIALGQTMNGSLCSDKDTDCYRLEITKTTTVQVYFTHDWFDNGSTYWRVYVDAKPSNQDRRMSINLSGRDSNVHSTDSLTLTPGTYYITVSSYYWSDIPYTITIK